MRLGVVGAGGIARLVAPMWQEVAQVETVAICSRTRRSGEELADLLHKETRPTIYTDYQQMLTDGNVDVVYVCVPNHLHFCHARDALLAGKHVIVEKPFTVSAAAATQLAALAQNRGLFVWEAVMSQFTPMAALLHDLSRQIGTIKLIQANYWRTSRRYAAYRDGEVEPAFDPKSAGGALMDLNVYNLHLVVDLLGEPDDGAIYQANKGFNGIDTSGVAVLTYPQAQAVCVAAKDSDGPMNCVIAGENGTIWVDSLPVMSSFVRLVKDGAETIHTTETVNPYVAELQEFMRQVDQQDWSARDQLLAQTLTVAKLLEELRSSAGVALADDAI